MPFQTVKPFHLLKHCRTGKGQSLSLSLSSLAAYDVSNGNGEHDTLATVNPPLMIQLCTNLIQQCIPLSGGL